MNEIRDIEIKYIESLIPNILLKKLERFEFHKVDDIFNISLEEFQKLPTIGKTVVAQLNNLRNLIEKEPEKVIEEYNSSKPKLLPFEYSDNLNVLELFVSLIEDYLSVKKAYNFKTTKAKQRHLRDIDVIRKYYGLNSKKYDRDKIATRHRIKTERVRQIILFDFIPEIIELINGEFLSQWKCKCRDEAIELIQSYKKDLAGSPILSDFKLSLWLKDYGIEKSGNVNNYFSILLNTWGYEQLALSRHYMLRNNIFYADDSVEKELFLNLSTKVLIFIREKVIPVSFDDIVIEVLEEFDVEDDFIRLTCEIIYDIEKIDIDYYQIRFENLASINDYVYRLLYEKKKQLSYNELLHLLNKRLVDFNKEITMESLKQGLHKDDYIVPVGKMGIWTLSDLNTNIESQINLILKSIRILDRPLTVSEITRNINESFLRRDVTVRSVSSNLRNYKKYFIKLKGNRFVLTETMNLYKNEISKTKAPIKKKGILKTDEVTNKVIDILKNTFGNKMKLNKLVSALTQTNSNYSAKDIYKAIRENPLIFKKEKTSSSFKIISLISQSSNINNELNYKYKWNELRIILERELAPIFNSNVQPTYVQSLSDSLDAFFKLIAIDINHSCTELADLADRILPTLYKFYVGASDRNDKLNFLKQIVTSQESYFKKLLFYIDAPSYNFIKSYNKGFGSVLDKLTKLDQRKNRYQKYKSASNFEFGKHCSRAYGNRNIDTHNANSWTESEIIETKTSCIVFMVYGAFEYYNEIKNI